VKNLLLILALFSSISLTNEYFICDKPYIFFPDIKERVILEIKDEREVIRRHLSTGSLEIISFFYNHFEKNKKHYQWKLFSGDPDRWPYLNELDRATLVLNEDLSCEVASSQEHNKVIKEFDDFISKELKKRKI